MVTLPAGKRCGQTEPCRTFTDPGYPIVIDKDVPNDVAYRVAKALHESRDAHRAAEDIFYSTPHAANTYRELHPGAARHYRALGVLK